VWLGVGRTASDLNTFLTFTPRPLIKAFLMEIIPAHGTTVHRLLQRRLGQIFETNWTIPLTTRTHPKAKVYLKEARISVEGGGIPITLEGLAFNCFVRSGLACCDGFILFADFVRNGVAAVLYLCENLF